MAVLYISEHDDLGQDRDGHNVQALKVNPIATQAVTFTTSTQSAALNARTRFVRVLSTAAALIEIGTNPTAVPTSMAIAGEVPETFAVPADATLKIAAVTR